MAVAARALTPGVLAAIGRHEATLTEYALERLRARARVAVRRGLIIGRRRSRGLISFTVDGVPHGLVAAVLGYEDGIGVRSGCFCAQPYVAHLLGDSEEVRTSGQGATRDRPGLVRISFGAYNTLAEIDAAIDAIARVARGGCEARYRFVTDHGVWEPA